MHFVDTAWKPLMYVDLKIMHRATHRAHVFLKETCAEFYEQEVIRNCWFQVKTDIKYGKDTPLFNAVLRLPLQFPSMCERLKVQLYDW